VNLIRHRDSTVHISPQHIRPISFIGCRRGFHLWNQMPAGLLSRLLSYDHGAIEILFDSTRHTTYCLLSRIEKKTSMSSYDSRMYLVEFSKLFKCEEIRQVFL